MDGEKELTEWFSSREFLTFFISILPVTELRGGLPFALSQGIPPIKAYLISVAGNILPVIPLLLGLRILSRIAKRYKTGIRVFNWLTDKMERKKRLVKRYGIPGIVLLVAIPLPLTGAWTGSIVSSLLFIPIKYAFPAILTGICIAGVIVLLVSLGILGASKIFVGM